MPQIYDLEQPMPDMLVKKFLAEQMIVISKGTLPVANSTLMDQELDTSNQLFFEWNPSFRAWYDSWIGDRNYPTIRLDAASLIKTFMTVLKNGPLFRCLWHAGMNKQVNFLFIIWNPLA